MSAKISLGLSIILFLLVGYLLYKTHSGSGLPQAKEEPVVLAPAFTGDSAARATVVAFVNGDSLNMKYDFITEKSKDLEAKMKAAEARVKVEYGRRQQKYEANMAYAQQNPNMPESEAIALEKEMNQLQMEMDEIQEREVGVLKKKEIELQQQLLERVHKYLDVFAKQKGIDYVINKQSEFQMILYGSSSYDVTSEVLAGLNAEYRAEKENAVK